MDYPPLLTFTAEEEYRQEFERLYCRKPTVTHDGISVRFNRSDFDHCAYRSKSMNDKSIFSLPRAQRIHWIGLILQDPAAELFFGWDRVKRRVDRESRVALTADGYVVVIRFISKETKQARFVTAYQDDGKRTAAGFSLVQQIRRSPKWE